MAATQSLQQPLDTSLDGNLAELSHGPRRSILDQLHLSQRRVLDCNSTVPWTTVGRMREWEVGRLLLYSLHPLHGPALRACFHQLPQVPTIYSARQLKYPLEQPSEPTPKCLTCLGPELLSLTSSEMCFLDAYTRLVLVQLHPSSPSSTPPFRPSSASLKWEVFISKFFKGPHPYFSLVLHSKANPLTPTAIIAP